jgi:hypothetical protein
VVLIGLSLVITSCGSSSRLAKARCTLGASTGPGTELISPRRNTFYSVDALNPDVVAFKGSYLMYFSGNNQPTANGNWRTGVAIARSPTGPFRIQATFQGNYLNGGTAVWRGQLWHAVELNPNFRGELASSSDGIHWRHESYVPAFTRRGRRYTGADFFLEADGKRLEVYMLAVPSTGGIGRSLAVASYSNGRWTKPRIILDVASFATISWARADLGEPAAFHAGGQHYLLFVGLSRDLTRSIGLARQDNGAWVSCSSTRALPNDAPWGGASSIDPSPLVLRDRLYLYYGGTRTKGLAADLGGSIGVRVFVLHAT